MSLRKSEIKCERPINSMSYNQNLFDYSCLEVVVPYFFGLCNCLVIAQNPAHCHDQAYLIVFANMSDLEQ